MVQVDIYTREGCPYCARAKTLLAKKGINYKEIDASGDRRPEMIERSNGRNTFPQIFINNKHIGGCDDLFAADADGSLDRYLKG